MYIAYARDNKEARKHCRQMLKFLQNRFPLPRDVKVVLKILDQKCTYVRTKYLPNRLSATGTAKLSVVNCCQQEAIIKVVIKGRPVISTVKTVAHEYRHIMQAALEKHSLTYNLPTHKSEIEATCFGRIQSIRYFNTLNIANNNIST